MKIQIFKNGGSGAAYYFCSRKPFRLIRVDGGFALCFRWFDIGFRFGRGYWDKNCGEYWTVSF